MPIVPVRRENRTFPRYFKPCDVARIARNCVEDNNIDRKIVLACVAKGMGFARIAIDEAEPQVVEAGINLSKGRVNLIKNAIKVAIPAIKSRFPRIGVILEGVIEVLDQVERVVDRLTRPDTEKTEDVLEKGDCDCKPGEVEKWLLRISRNAES